jgi:hypothetical protein
MDRKKLIDAVVLKFGGKPPKDEGKPMDDSEGEGESDFDTEKLDTIAEELLDAVNNNDKKALAEVLKSFMERC